MISFLINKKLKIILGLIIWYKLFRIKSKWSLLRLLKHSNGHKMKKEIQKIWQKKEYYKWLIVKRIKIILLNYKNIELKIKKLKLIGDKIVA